VGYSGFWGRIFFGENMISSKLLKGDFEKILENYDIGRYIFHKYIFTGTNTVFVIKTSRKKYLMKIYENAPLKFVQHQMHLMNYLGKKNILTPRIIKTNENKDILTHNKKIITIQEFFEGVHPKKFSKELLKDIAKNIGKLSRALFKYEEKFNYDWGTDHQFKPLKWKVKKILNLNLEIEDKALIKEIKNINKLKLKKCIIHADLGKDNILIKKGKLSAFIDWDDAHTDYLVYELAPFIFDNLIGKNKINKRAIKIFLKEYQKYVKLNNEEKRALYFFIKSRILASASWVLENIHKHPNEKEKMIKWVEKSIIKYKIFEKLKVEDFLKLF
jgi:homoserine kinase type II